MEIKTIFGKIIEFFTKNENRKFIYIGTAAIVAVVVLILVLCLSMCSSEEPEESVVSEDVSEEMSEEVSEEVSEEISEEISEEVSEEESLAPTEDELKLQEIAPLYSENPDMCAWMKIDGTVVDYPVMYTPNNPNKYLRADFYGNYSRQGSLIMDKRCILDPESENLIVHGHNMTDGSMFRLLHNYPKKTYRDEHPIIKLYIGNEVREYEVFAVFYDKVYYKTDTCFKFYEFTEADTQERFDEGIRYFKSHSVYDTGITPEYGERLLTLVTCSYHVTNGRLVVVAREITK